MKRRSLLIPAIILLFASCSSHPNGTSGLLHSDTASANKAEPDITMTATQFTTGAMNDKFFADNRTNKRIKITGVEFGGYEKLGPSDMNLWGNDGDVHWNGDYMCCRFIFKIANPNEQTLIAAKGRSGNIIATLIESRDNQSSPLGQPVITKEFVFDNAVFELNAQAAAPAPQQTSINEAAADTSDGTLAVGKINVDQAYFYDTTNEATKTANFLPKGMEVMYHTDHSLTYGKFYWISISDDHGNIMKTGWILKSNIDFVSY